MPHSTDSTRYPTHFFKSSASLPANATTRSRSNSFSLSTPFRLPSVAVSNASTSTLKTSNCISASFSRLWISAPNSNRASSPCPTAVVKFRNRDTRG